jgi:hypothetical protein
MESNGTAPTPPPRRLDRLHITLITLLAVIVGAGLTYWLIRSFVFPTEFTPVRLSPREEEVLTDKLERLESLSGARGPGPAGAGPADAGPAPPPEPRVLEPEPYSEVGATREIALTEKELNAMLARNTDLARRLAIDLSGNLVSARLLVPLDPDFPILGGETLTVRAGVEFAYGMGKPVVALKGLSLMGVPLPNAWIGGIKNIDLVQEFGAEEGFWKSFAEGVEDIRVEDGRLLIKLKE